jgi:transcriptional regulator with XRE-family HTH domain
MDQTRPATGRVAAGANRAAARATTRNGASSGNRHTATRASSQPAAIDGLVLGRRIRHLRTAKGLTLDQLGAAIGRAASRVSAIETGQRIPTIDQLESIAKALEVETRDLLGSQPFTKRDALEIDWERIQNSPGYQARGLPRVRPAKTLSNQALDALIALYAELERMREERVATPEEARRANAALREEMRAQDDYFPDLEAVARKMVDLAGLESGEPMAHTALTRLAGQLGLALEYVRDLPHSTRSVLDMEHGRLYLPVMANAVTGDHRSALLQALASYVLKHGEPEDYKTFLRQRVQANYLAAAVLMPETQAVPFLRQAKMARSISIEDLRDRFGVSFEMAAHRFANLATRHLDIALHFMKVHSSGVVHKAYENDGLLFPTDPLGAIEGQPVCRHWAARTVFDRVVGKGPYAQYTDTTKGTYWTTSHVKEAKDGVFSVSVGAGFEDSRFFKGSDTRWRERSSCPDPACCQLPPANLAQRWDGKAWPAARPHSSVLAAMPAGAFPGVDLTDVYQFLDRHT